MEVRDWFPYLPISEEAWSLLGSCSPSGTKAPRVQCLAGLCGPLGQPHNELVAGLRVSRSSSLGSVITDWDSTPQHFFLPSRSRTHADWKVQRSDPSCRHSTFWSCLHQVIGSKAGNLGEGDGGRMWKASSKNLTIKKQNLTIIHFSSSHYSFMECSRFQLHHSILLLVLWKHGYQGFKILFMFSYFWVPLSAMLRAFSWFCTQGITPNGEKRTIWGRWHVKPGKAACKVPSV